MADGLTISEEVHASLNVFMGEASDGLSLSDDVSVLMSLVPVLDVQVADELDMGDSVSCAVVSPGTGRVGAFFFMLKHRR